MPRGELLLAAVLEQSFHPHKHLDILQSTLANVDDKCTRAFIAEPSRGAGNEPKRSRGASSACAGA